MNRLEKIRDIIEDYDSLVKYNHGNEHCILPEHYDELAKKIDESIDEVEVLE